MWFPWALDKHQSTQRSCKFDSMFLVPFRSNVQLVETTPVLCLQSSTIDDSIYTCHSEFINVNDVQ